MIDDLKYQKTTKCYDIKYIKTLFNDAEINRYFKLFQSRLIVYDKEFNILPDFIVECVCKNTNRLIDVKRKICVIELLIKHKCVRDAIWHGNRRAFDSNQIVNGIKGTFKGLVDRKDRTHKTNYESNMINGMYKQVKFDKEHQDLQLFAGF